MTFLRSDYLDVFVDKISFIKSKDRLFIKAKRLSRFWNSLFDSFEAVLKGIFFVIASEATEARHSQSRILVINGLLLVNAFAMTFLSLFRHSQVYMEWCFYKIIIQLIITFRNTSIKKYQ
jgi:hypothetical protein